MSRNAHQRESISWPAEFFPLGAVSVEHCACRLGRDQCHDVGIFERSPIRSVRSEHAVPKWRVRALHRLEHHRHLVEFVEFTAESELVGREALFDDPQRFRKLARPVGWIYAEETDLDRRDPATDSEPETAATHLVQHADFFDQADRMIKWHRIDEGTESKPFRTLSNGGEEHAWRRCQTERCAVVLGHVIGVEAMAVILLDQRQPVRKMPVLRNAAVVHVLEDSKFHLLYFPCGCIRESER